MSFRFRENSDPTNFCSSAAEQLVGEALDSARVVIAVNEAGDYDPLQIRSFWFTYDRKIPWCKLSVSTWTNRWVTGRQKSGTEQSIRKED